MASEDQTTHAGYQIYSRSNDFPSDGKWMSWLDILSDLGEAKAALSIARSRYAHLGWEWKILEVRELSND